MKILIFNWKDIKHPWAGGAEVNIHEQAKRWIKLGHRVTQFSPSFNGASSEEIIEGVRIVRSGGRFSVYIIAFFKYLFKLRKDADVIVDIENGIPFFTPLYSRKPKLMILHHVHQDVFFKELPFFVAWIPYILEKYGIRLFYKNCRFIAVSNTTKDEMIERLGIKKDIQIVYNGLDESLFNIKIKRNSYPTVLYFGRLMKYKRIDLLIDIFAVVLKKIPNAKLVIAGSGIVEEELKEKVKLMGLGKSVEFLGFVDDKKKKDVFGSSWLFVNPSSMEGWGVTVIEANAAKIPALAFNVPGLREAIKNNETGYIVSSKGEMVDKIISLLKDHKLRNKFGENAFKWSKNFSWDKTASITLKMLEEIK